MTTFNASGSGGPNVSGSGDLRLRHNLTGSGGVRVEGAAALIASLVLRGSGGPQVSGQGGLDLVPPTVVSVVPSTSTVVRVTFDTGMVDNAALADPNNYSITPVGAGAPVAVNAVTPEAVSEPTYVDLTITEMTDSEIYDLTATTIEDPQGAIIDPASTAFTGLGVAPQVSAAVAVTATKTRVTFDEPMDLNSGELLNPANYTITPTAGAGAVFVTSVEASGANPTEVELITSEMTEGGAYEATVDGSGNIRDAAFNTIDAGFVTAAFTGKGDAPELHQLVAISSTRVNVVFSEPMKDNADIRDPANYIWTPAPPTLDGVLTLSVLDLDNDTLQLVTSEQTEGVLYTLTIG